MSHSLSPRPACAGRGWRVSARRGALQRSSPRTALRGAAPESSSARSHSVPELFRPTPCLLPGCFIRDPSKEMARARNAGRIGTPLLALPRQPLPAHAGRGWTGRPSSARHNQVPNVETPVPPPPGGRGEYVTGLAETPLSPGGRIARLPEMEVCHGARQAPPRYSAGTSSAIRFGPLARDRTRASAVRCRD
jgi:hypothetical protein